MQLLIGRVRNRFQFIWSWLLLPFLSESSVFSYCYPQHRSPVLLIKCLSTETISVIDPWPVLYWCRIRLAFCFIIFPATRDYNKFKRNRKRYQHSRPTYRCCLFYGTLPWTFLQDGCLQELTPDSPSEQKQNTCHMSDVTEYKPVVSQFTSTPTKWNP